ncbi:hypothetical protein [Desulfitobacterium hafniense]|uniref:Uncharacterized protein n=1 Tax=Desulfitobacterium hafniense DP7 TaxID=537010 RepID=G9XIC0_DESHA|nr:hypothetical protein [Desulfitobacterium hafniense]EHL08603.1 hypothetical protein HMPREF0322_00696 [Desulfitobacterium hafniense DP7]
MPAVKILIVRLWEQLLLGAAGIREGACGRIRGRIWPRLEVQYDSQGIFGFCGSIFW